MILKVEFLIVWDNVYWVKKAFSFYNIITKEYLKELIGIIVPISLEQIFFFFFCCSLVIEITYRIHLGFGVFCVFSKLTKCISWHVDEMHRYKRPPHFEPIRGEKSLAQHGHGYSIKSWVVLLFASQSFHLWPYLAYGSPFSHHLVK